MTASPTILDELTHAFVGYARWFVRDATHPSTHSYVSLLVVLTVIVLVAERLHPWRTSGPGGSGQRRPGELARGLVYAFLNFFGFGLLGYAALSDVSAARVAAVLGELGIPHLDWSRFRAHSPTNGLLAIGAYLVVRDLIEYWIHRLLHRVRWLWRFHALHHAARSMQVLVHLRFHPLETVVYRSIELIPMTLLGFGVGDFFVAHAFALLVGHLNHANLRLPLGPLRYVVNSAEMHLLHHAKVLPKDAGPRAAAAYGVNFGLTFSVWDFVFGTASLPTRDAPPVDPNLELGFEGVERYPVGLASELLAPFHEAAVPPPLSASASASASMTTGSET